MKPNWIMIAALLLLVAFAGLAVHTLAAGRTNAQAYFVENQGQFPDAVRFASEGPGGSFWVLSDSFRLGVLQPIQTEPAFPEPPSEFPRAALALQFSFPNSPPTSLALRADQPIDLHRTYLTPAGQFSGVPVWGLVAFEGLYPGLDLEFRSLHGRIGLVFTGKLPAGITAVELEISGGAGMLRRADQGAVLGTAIGDAYLPITSEVPGLVVALTTPEGARLVFTPDAPRDDAASGAAAPAGTLVYGSYFGEQGFHEHGSHVAVDSSGSAYYAGSGDTLFFTEQTGLYAPDHLVKSFVIKLNPSGTAAEYIVTISGADPDGEDYAMGIAIDGEGQAYVAGLSSSDDFPATPGAFDTTPNGNDDAWLAKIDAAGNVAFATLIGSAGFDWANAVGVGLFGEIYVSGFTDGPGFPKTAGSYDSTHNGGWDVFVSKFNSTGTTLLAGTFIGGSGNDGGDLGLDRSDIVIDGVGNAYITGPTSSADFPSTNPRIGPGGCKDIYVAKLTPDLGDLYFSTRIGGSGTSCGTNGDDNAEKLALDPAGNIYITGYTSTENGKGFPTTAGAYDTSYNGFYDAFLLKLNPTASAVLYGTYLGGSSVDVAKDVAVDLNGRVYLTGYTFSGNYPVTGNAFDTTLGGGLDAFVTKLNPAGGGIADLVYSTFLGGSGSDQGVGLSVRGQDIVYLTGLTDSPNFPTTPGSLQEIYSGDQDAYLVLLHLPDPIAPPPPAPTWTPAPHNLNLPITPRQGP